MVPDHEHDDEVLLEELALLVEQLRLDRYEQTLRKVRDVPSLVAEEFSDLFSRHLLFEEDLLFPALREPAPPGAGKEFDELLCEHGKLRGFAQDLVRRVRGGDLPGACETGRLFMAALLDHIRRETEITRQYFSNLEPSTAERVKQRFDAHPPSAAR